MRKGIFASAGLAVLTLILATSLASIGVKKVLDLDNRLKKETVNLVAQRTESTIYMVHALDRAEVEMGFDDDTVYWLQRKDGKKLLMYQMDPTLIVSEAKNYTAEIKPPEGIDFSITESKGEKFCIERSKSNSKLAVEAGDC